MLGLRTPRPICSCRTERSPARCTNAEPPGFLLCCWHTMCGAVLVQTLPVASQPSHRRARLNGDRVLFALLAITGTGTGKRSAWRMSSSTVVPAWGSSASEILLLVSPPRPPWHCREGLRAVGSPKSFHRSLWGSLFYFPATVCEYHEYSSSIHPTVSLSFLQSLEGYVQNRRLRVTGKLGKIRKCSEI